MDQSNEDAVFTQTTTDHSSGVVTVTHHRYHPARIIAMTKDRMAVCKGCNKLTKLKTCSLCSCFMPAKVAIPLAACPDGKWKEEP